LPLKWPSHAAGKHFSQNLPKMMAAPRGIQQFALSPPKRGDRIVGAFFDAISKTIQRFGRVRWKIVSFLKTRPTYGTYGFTYK
jgi:hypothetical protein